MTESNPEVLNQEIAALQEQIAQKRAELGQDASAPYERGEVHAVVGEKIQQQASGVPLPVAPSSGSGSDLPSWQDPAIAMAVQELVTVAFTKGVDEAISQAFKSGNAAVMDALHDVLADELHQELVNRQLVQQAA